MNHSEFINNTNILNKVQKDLLFDTFDPRTLNLVAQEDRYAYLLFNAADTEVWVLCVNDFRFKNEKGEQYAGTYEDFIHNFFNHYNNDISVIAEKLYMKPDEVLEKLTNIINTDDNSHVIFELFDKGFTFIPVKKLLAKSKITNDNLQKEDGSLFRPEELDILNRTFYYEELMDVKNDDDDAYLVFNKDCSKVWLVSDIKSNFSFDNPKSVLGDEQDFMLQQICDSDYDLKVLAKNVPMSPKEFTCRLMQAVVDATSYSRLSYSTVFNCKDVSFKIARSDCENE